MTKIQKLYCYVDESGQDTKGKLFLVSVVITGLNRDNLRNKLKHMEKVSKKGNKKWTKATFEQRKKYIEMIVNDKDFIGSIFYSKYLDTCAYVDLTILTTAKSVLDRFDSLYETIVFVDGLRRTERHRFAAGLRRLKVKIKKVRGIKDQSDEFIRLADAIAGFVRSSLKNNQTMKVLYEKARKNRIIKNV